MTSQTTLALGVISFWHIVIVLVIVLLLFGGGRLRNLGGDIGAAIKGFKESMSDDKEKEKEKEAERQREADAKVIEGTVEKKTIESTAVEKKPRARKTAQNSTAEAKPKAPRKPKSTATKNS